MEKKKIGTFELNHLFELRLWSLKKITNKKDRSSFFVGLYFSKLPRKKPNMLPEKKTPELSMVVMGKTNRSIFKNWSSCESLIFF